MKKFTRTEIEEQVADILVDKLYNVKRAEIFPESKLMADLGADSIDVVEVDIAIEKAFRISIPDDEFYALKEMNVRELCDLVERLQN